MNVVEVVRGLWLRVELSRSGRPSGYLRRDDAIPTGSEPETTDREQRSSLKNMPSLPSPSPTGEESSLTREADTILRSVPLVSGASTAAFAAAEASRLNSWGRFDRIQLLRMEALSREGLQAMKQKEYQKAVGAYETILTIDPDNFSALFNLAGAYYELNQPDTAIEYSIRAIRRNAQSGMYFVVASAYVKKGDRQRAFSWLGKAIEGGFTDRGMIQENFATFQNDPVYHALIQKLSCINFWRISLVS